MANFRRCTNLYQLSIINQDCHRSGKPGKSQGNYFIKKNSYNHSVEVRKKKEINCKLLVYVSIR